MKIPLTEYAQRLGKNPKTARHRAKRGSFKTAEKLGRDWFIDADEPWIDNRVKSGKYRKKENKDEGDEHGTH